MFCGAGGTSQGMLAAANELEADLELIAINHWSVAIDTHSLNHPYAKHLCTGIDSVDPRALVPGGRLKVMCASPECTHHSVARGGRPMNDQSRSSAWHILRFAEALYIENLVIENVKEFQSWGPLGANGRPMISKRGQLFAQFISSLRSLGYNVEWKVLNCADYGDPTTRERLFIIARRKKAITWPEPSHMRINGTAKLFVDDTRKPWRTAREIIDWTMPSRSIFNRKKPLADKTLKRIEAGLRKFCNISVDLQKCMREDLRPFIVVLRGTGTTASVDEPLHTVTASGTHYGLVEPFVLGQQSGSAPRATSDPLPTVATDGAISFIEPFIVPNFGEREGQEPRTHSLSDPAPTVTSHGAGGLVEPFLLPIDHAGSGPNASHSINAPVGTLVTKENRALVTPYMITVNHGDEGDSTRRANSVDDPMRTVTQKIGEAICEPFIVSYYGTENMSRADDPIPTVTTKDRFAVVEARQDKFMLDIRFRMLSPRELARAQGFPDSYEFTGNREAVVKQIGNAVPPGTAKALLMEVLA